MSTSRKLLIVSVIIIILGIAFVMWWNAQNAIPNIKIPTPVMPSPNAYDYYIRAADSIVEAGKIGYAITNNPQPTPTSSPSSSSTTAISTLDRVYSLAEKEDLVARNTQALKLLREGFAYEYKRPPVRSFNRDYRYFSKYRTMAWLLVLEGQTKAKHGDWNNAMDSCLDAFRLGEDVPRGGDFYDKLTGISVQTIARKEAWGTIEHLTTEEAIAAVRRMETIIATRVTMAETYEQEKWALVASLIKAFKTDNLSKIIADLQSMSGNNPNNILLELRLRMCNKRKIINNIMYYMDELISYSRLPYAAKMPEPVIPKDAISQLFLPVVSRTRFADIRCEVENALLLTALGLRAYRMEHGEYPKTLMELTPKYLKKLPNDPLALKGSLQYKRKGKTYILYSLGPDCKDDGGKPIDDPRNATAANPNLRYKLIDSNSKGDIVAGINTRY